MILYLLDNFLQLVRGRHVKIVDKKSFQDAQNHYSFYNRRVTSASLQSVKNSINYVPNSTMVYDASEVTHVDAWLKSNVINSTKSTRERTNLSRICAVRAITKMSSWNIHRAYKPWNRFTWNALTDTNRQCRQYLKHQQIKPHTISSTLWVVIAMRRMLK